MELVQTIGDTLKDRYGVNRATTGFSNIVKEAVNPATMFGAESLSARVFSSTESRAKAANTQTNIKSGYSSLGNGTSEQLERNTDELEGKTDELIDAVKSLGKNETAGGQVENKTVSQIKAEMSSEGITKSQGEQIIALLESQLGATKRAGNAQGGGSGFFDTAAGVAGGFGAFKAVKAGAKAVRGRFGTTTPKPVLDTKTNRFRDPTTGRFTKAPADVASKKAAKEAREKVKQKTTKEAKGKIQKKVAGNVGKKVALKIGAKFATRGALAATGIGAIASAGLLAFDVGEAVFSEGARKEYTLANPMASEEEKAEAVNWLIKNDPERVGIPEEISEKDRMSFLEQQETNPELDAKTFNETKFENEGPSTKDVAELQRKITKKTSGMFNLKSNDLAEAQEEISQAGLEGKVFARETDSGIQIETATEKATRMEAEKAAAPIVISSPTTNSSAPQGEIIVALPKTILSLNESARRFVAFRA